MNKKILLAAGLLQGCVAIPQIHNLGHDNIEEIIQEKYNKTLRHETTAETRNGEEYKVRGVGVAYQDYFFTVTHTIKVDNMTYMSTPFGTITTELYSLDDVVRTTTRIGNKELKLLHQNEISDIAIFKIPQKYCAELCDYDLEISLDHSLGTPVFNIGIPGGDVKTVKQGIISTLPVTREDVERLHEDDIVQMIGLVGITNDVFPGGSGGDVFDKYGRLVGITVSVLNETGYIIPVGQYLDVIKK